MLSDSSAVSLPPPSSGPAEGRGSRLLPPLGRRRDRPAAPDEVWDIDRFVDWRETAWALMADVFDVRVRRAFRRSPPEYVVGDDLGWLDRIVHEATGREIDTKEAMAARLSERFEVVRACHATNTADVGTYYEQGIVPLDPEAAHQAARTLFLDGRFPELVAADVEKAIAGVGHGLRAGRVYFEANERMLLKQCGHYLLYGGEYLTAIAANLPRYRDYRQFLKERGQPTMLICDVPLTALGGATLLELAGKSLELMFQALLDGRDYVPDPHRGCGFCIRGRLLPERIVGHYQPFHVRDPLLGYR